MKPLVQLLILMVSLHTGFADVLIYRATEKVKATGNGRVSWDSYQGYWILNLDTADLFVVRWSTLDGHKTYFTYDYPYARVSKIDGNQGRSFSVLREALSSQSGPWTWSFFLKGENKNLNVAPNTQVSYPRTMSGQVRDVFPVDGAPACIEASISFTFAERRTVASNTAGDDLQTITDRIISELQDKGYQPNGESQAAINEKSANNSPDAYSNR